MKPDPSVLCRPCRLRRGRHVLRTCATWVLLVGSVLSPPTWAGVVQDGTALHDRIHPVVMPVDGVVGNASPWLQQLAGVTRTMVARSRTCLLHVSRHDSRLPVPVASDWLPVCQQAPWDALSLYWGRYDTGYAPMQQERAFDQPDSGFRLWLRWHWQAVGQR